MRRADSLEKALMLGKIEGREKREQKRVRWPNVITNSMGMIIGRLQKTIEWGGAGVLESRGTPRVDTA